MAVDAQMHRPPMTANARMRDSACPKFRTDAKPTEQARFDNPTPPHFHPLNEWGIILDAAVGRTRNLRVAQGCAIMLAPSFARCETNRASVNAQGCAMAVTQSRYARMHKDSHTKPLHDATALMAVGARTRRPQRPHFDSLLFFSKIFSYFYS